MFGHKDLKCHYPLENSNEMKLTCFLPDENRRKLKFG